MTRGTVASIFMSMHETQRAVLSSPPSKPKSIRTTKTLLNLLSKTSALSLHFGGFPTIMATQSTHGFNVKDFKGRDVNLNIYKGKVLLIVNVASNYGLASSNYAELATLYDTYKDQVYVYYFSELAYLLGLEILAFPCNQFGSQEPGTDEQIQELACTHFRAQYPIFRKIDVNGANAAPIYKYMKSMKGGLFWSNLKRNFTKYLIDKNGRVFNSYPPITSPLKLEDINKLLEK